MKKSFIALAVLGAFAGAASAQSSVTLYGIVDAYVGYRTAGENIAASLGRGDSKWSLSDGSDVNGKQTSRWGLRGSEDLGNGLSAYFTLEQGFNLDTGTAKTDANLGSPTYAFQRQAFVGVKSTTYGSLSFGRQYALAYAMQTYLDPTDRGQLKADESIGFSNGLAATNSAFRGTGGTALQFFNESGVRVNNSVQYNTPNFGGFEASLLGGAGEGTQSRYQGGRVTYRGGPIAVAASYEEFDGGYLNTGNYNKVATVGANYDFSVVKVFAGYQQTKDLGDQKLKNALYDDQTSYTVGASVPLGSFLVHASYIDTTFDSKTAGLADGKLKKYGIAVEYNLSKRTVLYSAYTQKAGDLKEFTTARREITLLGLRHAF